MTSLSLFLLIAGPFMGSFIHASALVWPDLRATLTLRSTCGHCQRKLSAFELVPILAWLVLQGKCRTCRQSITASSLIAELLAFAIPALQVFLFTGWPLLAGCLLGWTLLFAALVDARTRLLPDGSTLGLVALGLLYSHTQSGWPALVQAALGAVIGYVSFWLVAFVYKKLRGRDGLGLGDAKLLAAGGAWCGALALSWIVLLAAILALLFLLATNFGKADLRAETALAFGPALAIAIFLVWCWQGLQMSGLVLLP